MTQSNTFTDGEISMLRELLKDCPYAIQVEDMVQFLIDSHKRMLEEFMRCVPDVNYGEHLFEIGYRHCNTCNEPMYIQDRKVLNRIVDEKSGGETVTVTEKTYDLTGMPCSKNPSYGFNQCREAVIKNVGDRFNLNK